MEPTIKILEKINQNSNKNKDEVFTRLYRYLLRADIYYVAYKNLYANNGAATKGVNNDTADGFSEDKISKIIASLTDGNYRPKPLRRTYIAKANGKMRPLGIPTFTDKLVQEVLRMILEAVYEPVFSKFSHGFRPNRSCHTALDEIKHRFSGSKWFIEGDIKGCFDNIDHKRLIEIINVKIKDAKLIQLIWKFLKAGYLENWKFNKTHSGTPQGGIVSPILANIYLNELDKKVEQMSAEFYVPRKSLYTPEYEAQQRVVRSLREKINRKCNADRRTELLKEWRKARAIMMSLPAKSQTDKKIKYIRYADDFIIGVNGSQADCERIKAELKSFIGEKLKMELSEEKTLITHSSENARFLGYDIKVRRSGEIKPSQGCGGLTKRTFNHTVDLTIPLKDKIEKFLFKIEAVSVKDGALYPIKREALIRLTDLEIMATFNAELRGICNYYSLASNYKLLNYFAYLMEYSCLKTFAAKYDSTIGKIKTKFRDGRNGWGVPYTNKTGKKRLYFPKYQNCKNSIADDTISKDTTKHKMITTSFEKRLKAKVCELCGSENSEKYELHHVNKVKNLKGKEHWERIMIAKRRKTIVLCYDCHLKVHGKGK
ncbi:MAG: reverse transcriptase domain-containing protein [Firmicutes bacterium]|nr:reverse transcriptase domain-containing protein [Bacillota bacterium]